MEKCKDSDSESETEAIQKFKMQITKSLSLLSLMDSSDREEVWRFWKTVSAAIKIAVNGRGNIIQTPKSQRKSSIQDTDFKRQKHYLQELDQNAISIYVPLKSSKAGMNKYRVLKFANQVKIADYLEEAQNLDCDDNNVNKRVRSLEGFISDEDGNSENEDVSPKGIQSSILGLITASVKDDADDGLKSVAKYFENAPSRHALKLQAERNVSKTKSVSVDKNCKSISSKKIWPVGRPTTRSFSSGAKNCSPSNAYKNSYTLNSGPSDTSPTFQKDLQKATVTSHSDLNILGLRQNIENDMNARKFSASNSVLHADHGEIYTNLKGDDSNLQAKDNQEVVSIDSIGHAVSGSIPSFEMYVNSGSECSKDEAVDSKNKDSESQSACSTLLSEHQSQSSQSRNTSDIETIISALEEELKKSGSNLTNISVSPHVKSWPLSNSVRDISNVSQATASVENEMVGIKELPDTDSSVAQNVSETDLDDSQISCLSLETSVEQQDELENTVGHNDETMHYASRHEINRFVGEPTQTAANLQASPIKVAAYIDELGQTVPHGVGQVSKLLNQSGQRVQILHGQEVVEVDGSIDNIIWSCDGEVQIMQQLQQKEECGHIEEPVQPNQEMDTSEGLSESQPVQAHYDVVEYEVLSDKRLKRGRKKKGISEGEQAGEDNETENNEVLERTCPICHRVLNYASSMKAHMRIHTGARPYSCGQCDRKFTTKANRDRHEATHVGLKPFQCQECHKSFTEKRSLKIHMRSHTGERPFVCEICGQGFAQNCTLQVHKVRHTDRRAHLCDLCGKAFRQKNQLEVHVKRHKRQAAYPCDHCETRCYTRGDLVRHMVKHTGERPYVCQLCPRSFTRKQYLIDHENQHYNRKPYSCSECGMSFHDMGSCHRHLRKHKNTKEEDKEAPVKIPHKLPVLNVDVMQKMMSTAKPGQVLKLEDGSDAIVKEVTSDTDGSTVYHITCLNLVNDPATTTALSQYHQQQQQQLQEGLQPGNSQQLVDVEALALSQGTIIKVEDSENSCENRSRQEFKDTVMSDLSKVDDFGVVDIESHEGICVKR